MVNITIYQNGDVTGDKGRIIGYDDQKYSEPITIVHPLHTGAEYYIDYKYNQTVFRDKLDALGRVRLKIEKAGYLNCQCLAIDVLSGDVIWRSNSWNFIVNRVAKLEPSHYPCSSIIHGPIPPNCWNHSNYPSAHHHHHHCDDKSIDSYRAYYELLNELRNEEEIRYNETQALQEEIRKIKEALDIDNNQPSILDANEVVISGNYIAAVGSINFPVTEQECVLKVTTHGLHITQECTECDGDNVWYRTGEKINSDYVWTEWAESITRVTEL